MNTPDIPLLCSKRPTYSGLVIPYTTLVLPDGRPDFKTTDYQHWFECALGDLCAICGTYLPHWVWYIGSVHQCDSGRFIDLAMHEDCMRYAVSACPFIAQGRGYADCSPVIEGHTVVELAPAASLSRPSVMFASKRERGRQQIKLEGRITLVHVGREYARLQVGANLEPKKDLGE